MEVFAVAMEEGKDEGIKVDRFLRARVSCGSCGAEGGDVQSRSRRGGRRGGP